MELRKWGRLFPILLLLLVTLTACGKKEENTEATTIEIREKDYIGDTARNTIRLSPDGNVLEISVEDFSTITIDEKELKDYIQSEVDGYNTKLGVSKISFRQMKIEGNVVKLAISYSDLETYASFNRMSVKLSAYDAAAADRVAQEEEAKHQAEERQTETPVISDAELAEAGYSPEDLTEEGQSTESNPVEKIIKASFTGTAGNMVTSDEIPSGENLMLVTDERIAVELESGQIQYVNQHAVIQDGDAITDGDGTAIIVLFLGI